MTAVRTAGSGANACGERKNKTMCGNMNGCLWVVIIIVVLMCCGGCGSSDC